MKILRSFLKIFKRKIKKVKENFDNDIHLFI